MNCVEKLLDPTIFSINTPSHHRIQVRIVLGMASQVHINSLNLSLNFKPWFENLKPRFKNFKPRFERKSAH